MESDLIPYTASLGLPARAVLVLAPHPDDEVFGCGGAIAGHVRAGVPVDVVILTDGARFGDVATRALESRAAAKVLGYGEPDFWGLPDRGLRYSEDLVQRLVDRIAAAGVDLVYAPSPWEVHPDHRQTMMLAMEAVRRAGQPVRLAFYEVGAPLRPNVLLDITTLDDTKEAAMRCFESQLAQQDYLRHIRALNQYRTYTLPREVLAAEAYWVLAANELDQLPPAGLFTSVSPGLSAAATASPPAMPLVSILIRSMDRACLAEALDSVALQTYPHIEVVVVAACVDHRPVPTQCGPFALRLLQTDTPLPRSRAANQAMAQAHGDYFLFLDDDDWLMPGHIARLAHVLAHQPHALAVYTGISLVDAEGLALGQTFDLPFDAIRQMAGNLAPIHAVLFSAKVLDQGCRFDEALERFEDWDFWLQLAKLAPMVHLPGVSGAYRIHDSSGVHTATGPAGAATALVYQKWAPDWTPEQISQIMQRVWSHPELEAHLADTRQRLASTETAAAQNQNVMAQQAQSMLQQQQRIELLSRKEEEQAQSMLQQQQQFELLSRKEEEQAQSMLQQQQQFELLSRKEQEMAGHLAQQANDHAALLNSRSWRVTRPLRWFSTKLRLRYVYQTTARKIKRTIEILRDEGPAGLWRFLRRRMAGRSREVLHYGTWVGKYDSPTEADFELLAEKVTTLSHRPVISVVMPVYNPPLSLLREAVDSVRKQIYSDWELCIADDASTNPGVRELLRSLAAQDPRIKLVFREHNAHIVAASNSALAMATGEFVALLDHDDMIPRDALYWIAEAINRQPEAAILYSDEDKIGPDGKRCGPYFKSDWNLELFLSQNMISHLGVYRRSLVNEIGGFRPGYEGSQDYDLALRCVLKLQPSQIVHIPRVLYHWRILPGSTALANSEKSYAQPAGQRALSDFLIASGLGGRVESLPNGNYRVHPERPPAATMVSLIIPTRNALGLVRQCIESILTRTSYPNYEILLIDNGSDDPAALAYFSELEQHERIRVIRNSSEFNYSALNNRAVKQARGELIGLINNDIEIITPNWLDEMVGLALRPGVGAVGAKLWYPNETLQHGGFILGLGGVAGHAHWGITRSDQGYFGRAAMTQVLSAVTAACLVVRKSVYEQVGGLEENHLKIAFNDIDFCLKLMEAGYRNVWTPYAEMYHHESATRGADDTLEKKTRFSNEVGYMHRRWGDQLRRDAYYNVNLSLTAPSFGLAWPPRSDY